jgi:diguanylate cyclase (GGDEF)-like protein/PAS domain S-box-containing protein
MNRTREKDKTKNQSVDVAAELCQRVAGLEELETRHKQAAKALRESEERYRGVLETIQEGYYESDLAGNFTFFNDFMCQILGYPKEELVGMNYRQYTDQENTKKVFEAFNQVYKTEEPHKGYDYEIIRKDGSRKHVKTSVSIRKDASGKPIGFRGIVRDITERRKAEEEIAVWKNRCELLIADSGQLVYDYDISTGDMIWGACPEQVLGYSPDEMQGGIAQWEAMIHPEDQEKVLRMLKISEKYLTPFDVQYRLRHKDGAYRWIHDRGNFTTDGSGNTIRMTGMIRDISTQRRTEKELQESEARYDSLFRKNQAAMLMIDPETTAIVDANLGACVFYGYPYEKMLKLKMTDISTLAAEEVKTEMQRVLTEQYNHFYYQHRLANGQIREVEVYSGPLFMRGKQLLYSIIHDITERKRAEEALRQSEEKYRTILEGIEEGYYEVNLAGNFTFFNDSVCRIFGYPREELTGMNNRQYTDQENAEKLFHAFNKVYRSGEPHKGYDYEIIRKDGTKRYIETSVSLRKDSSGEPIGFRGVARDITDRQQAEEALRQSEEKYRTILESIEEGYYEVDLAGNFTFFNDSMYRSLGYSKEELMGMNDRQYTDRENAKRLFQAFSQVYRTGKPGKGFDYEVIRKDGTHRYVEGSILLRKDSSGNPIGFRGIVRDITERKRFEKILQQERETFLSILQKEPYGALLIDTDETFLFVNPEFTAITGYTLKDVPNGREWFHKAYPDPEYRHKIIAIWKQDVAPRKAVDRVWSVVCKDGQVKKIEFKLTFLDDGRVIVMLSDVTERKRTEEELAYKATHDLLTGLPNRMLFKDRFSVAIAQAQRVRKKLAVVFLDLDRFKEVNDTLGHDAGDGLLCAVGNRLIDLVRKTDTVARMGGDEFLLLLSDIDQVEDVISVAQKVQDVLQAPFIVDGNEISIGASIGIAIYPDDGTDVDSLVSHADKAMYEAKQRRHNSYPPFPQTVTDHASE